MAMPPDFNINYLKKKTEWLLQRPACIFLCCAARWGIALKAKDSGSKKHVHHHPSDKLSAFRKQQQNLTIKNGLIIPKNTSAFDVEAAAKSVIDITYLTIWSYNQTSSCLQITAARSRAIFLQL